MEDKERKRSNSGILKMIYFFSLLFFCMIGYMIYFIGWQAPDLMGSPYNSRMEVFDRRFIRGAILSSDGQVLARTETEGDTEKRVYPYGSLFAHSVGYSTKGKTGLEAAANFYLMESNINPLRQLFRELTDRKSPGDNVVTTLDTGLQKAASEALGERAGAVICMEPSTGKILAMVSYPGFDPNSIREDWEELTDEKNVSGNLVNRATQGLYPPGSTFKTLIALEYFREHPTDWQAFRFQCKGAYVDEEDPKYVVHCYNGEVHGKEDLKSAYANSCNSAFAKLGTELDRERLRGLADSLLFNQDLPIQILSSRSRFKIDGSSGTWTMMQSAIGQGETMMSPLHSLLITSAIANGGVLHEPVLIQEVESADGHSVKSFGSGEERRLLSESEAEELKQFMRAVVSEGTASKLKSKSYEACGKTGSAEYQSRGKSKTDAWFTGFAPMQDPKLAVCVLVEDGETGGRTAAPIAKAVFDYWLNR